jgi:hypothetical protein
MKHLVFLVLFLTTAGHAQSELTGRIIDAKTKKPLPFASISTKNSFLVADLDGNFSFNKEQLYDSIAFSYVGYEKLTISKTEQNRLLIKLNAISVDLQEIYIGKNPAVTIIEKVLQNKNTNDPERKLKSFVFKGYNNAEFEN